MRVVIDTSVLVAGLLSTLGRTNEVPYVDVLSAEQVIAYSEHLT